MLFNCIILAISSSIDSLGIGITYGIKNTKITNLAKLMLFMISFFISIISIYFGNILKFIFPTFIISYLGSIILILMGFFILFQSLNSSKKEYINKSSNYNIENTEKIYSLFIKCLGITIKIIKNPISSDLDKSNTIDSREALFLGIALSLDSFGIGIGFSMINNFSILFPSLISFFQSLFLGMGIYCGKKLYDFTKLPFNIWSTISGVLLVMIGFLKLFV